MIGLDRADGVWTVTLDRPEKANALTEDMLRRLAEIAEEAQEARAFVLTGTGPVFSAGADLEAARAGLARSPLWERLSGAIAALPCVSIAALNGTAAGGCMGMVLACDLRVAVPSAKFFYPVMKLGFLPQPSDPARLVALVGPARAGFFFSGPRKNKAGPGPPFFLFGPRKDKAGPGPLFFLFGPRKIKPARAPFFFIWPEKK